MIKIFQGVDALVELLGLRNPQTNDYVNDATVTLTLYDEDDAQVSGVSWPVAVPYVEDSDGDYRATISDAITPDFPSTGSAVFTIVSGSLNSTITIPVEFSEQTEIDLPWSSRDELNLLFGKASVDQWADLNNDGVESDIVERIRWACEEATADAKSRLGGSIVSITSPDRTMRRAVTRLAGVQLYEARGVVDTSDDEGRHRLLVHKKEAEKYFKRVLGGQIVIGGLTRASVPFTVDKDGELSSSIGLER